MKILKELKDVKVLSKTEQKALTGGIACGTYDDYCPGTSICCNGMCRAKC